MEVVGMLVWEENKMKNDKDIRRNNEGYHDPTPYGVLKIEQRDEERLVIRDMKTGKIWR